MAPFKQVLKQIRGIPEPLGETGYLDHRHFRTPELLAKYPEELLYFIVPEKLPEKPPLLILLHGGSVDRETPHHYLREPMPHAFCQSPRSDLREILGAYRLVTVMPSLYPNVPNGWCLPECETYLADVVREAAALFDVDPDRVFLAGMSMGGFGAAHICQCWPDRYAGILEVAGSWRLALWRNTMNTPFWFCHGINDAKYKIRGRFTDVAYGRLCDRLMNEAGVPHRYLEHDGGHQFHEPFLREFLGWAETNRRNNRPEKVFLSTPAGWRIWQVHAVKSRFWISVEKTGPGQIACHRCIPDDRFYGGHTPDKFDFSETEWNSWQLRYRKETIDGAIIEATREGNRFLVRGQNIAQFSIWPDAQMVDFRKPITVEYNGKEIFEGRVIPSPDVMLESYKLRRDYGLLYPAKISITV
ncbi:MAG: hypothetical protein NT011_01440 [Kiritimatiellaeota bacterium]|nr:hypothetical protein [Kiritimatiellota bacterium]